MREQSATMGTPRRRSAVATSRLLRARCGHLDGLAAALSLGLVLLDEGLDRLDRVVRVNELVVVRVRQKVREQILDVARALHAGYLENRVNLEDYAARAGCAHGTRPVR